MELPVDFPHKPPNTYKYEVEQFRSNVIRIWLLHPPRYTYSNDPVRTVWGFCKTTTRKKGSNSRTYYAPINANKVGEPVNIADTRPYTAMQLNLNPLEQALYS
tara:strand:+ start:444 stop:752 length:309 start_codon:yes stop_codon:yes gene_type:complete